MLTEVQLKEILQEMFRRVGREYSPEIVKDPDWFRASEWTIAEQQDFEKWLIKYVKRKHRGFTKEYIARKTPWFILDYGWRVKDV